MKFIPEKLDRILKCKADIKKALENKLKVSSISNKLADWPALINNISIIEEEPEEIIELDEYTHIWFLPSTNTNVISFQINISGETTIDWGDGTEPDVLTTPGLQFAQHIYSALPSANTTNRGIGCINYTIVEIKVYSEFDYTFEGQGATPNATMTGTSIPAFNTVANTLLKFIAAENCIVGKWGFAACNSLLKFVLSPKQTELYAGCFAYFKGLTTITIPQHITVINNCFSQSPTINIVNLHDSLKRLENSAFSGLSIKELEIPESVDYVGSAVCSNCKQLQKVIWKSPYKFIQTSAFSSCYNLLILDLSYVTEQMYFGTNINTTGTSSFIALIPDKTKIIVPKSLYNSWKANARWVYFKDYLYWRDEDGNLQNTEVL